MTVKSVGISMILMDSLQASHVEFQ